MFGKGTEAEAKMTDKCRSIRKNRIVSEKNMTVSESFITKYLSIV